MKKTKLIPLTEPEAVACLNALFSGWQLLEGLDAIEETTLYRHELKQRMKLLMPELEKFVDGVGTFFEVDNLMMNRLMEHRRELAKKLTRYRPEVEAGLNDLIGAYFEAPEEVLRKVGLLDGAVTVNY